ncbi:MAG TPA: transposase, partial [Tepidisphaeraceae bacterium]|nr:transposase [Tepidisphaeraceae bacterium]
MQVLTPNHQRRIVDFTPNRPWVNPGQKHELAGQPLPRSRWIRSLGHDDQLVEWFKPPQGPAYMSNKRYKALPQSIQVRELRGRVKHPATGQWIELTLLTTLTDEKRYPAKELIALYLRRWEAEVNLRHLKTTMRMQTLKCQDVAGVYRELAMFVLVYNLLRLLMTEAAHRQKTTPDRISFADVLGWT